LAPNSENDMEMMCSAKTGQQPQLLYVSPMKTIGMKRAASA